MNKIITTIAASVLCTMAITSSSHSLELVDVRIGATGNSSAYYVSGEEVLKDSGNITDKQAITTFSYMSAFAEVAIKPAMGLTIGLEYTPDALSTNTETTKKVQDAYNETTTQKASAEISDLMMAYVQMPIMGTGGYVRAGLNSANVKTKETLGTGSAYGDETIDGTHAAIGYMGTIQDTGVFYKVEALVMTFDGFTLTGNEAGGTTTSFNKVTAKDLTGGSARLSLGYQF